MVISIPDRTVKIYDSGKRSPGDHALRKEAEPFARRLPYALWFFAKDEDKEFEDRTEFTIKCIWKRVPRARPPYGDCGVYALKFLGCLMMGVELNTKHLNDNNMAEVRSKLAAEMYLATSKSGENMWDPTFVTDAMDKAVPVE
ncbi:hypothetical protein Bca52824_035296 [Brassica carinata]|uniref:Ubiquitin-like protease family profile domain-containing protein n=1 Tax=Brassica carinata TaxID=52824 RepID=A0A8X7S7C0_BRACI|nr:hypothetical protein Bca52824_035296 [Brassica carinata]